MGDIVKITPCISSSCAQNPILSLLIIYIIPHAKMYVAIDNPLLILSVLFHTAGS